MRTPSKHGAVKIIKHGFVQIKQGISGILFAVFVKPVRHLMSFRKPIEVKRGESYLICGVLFDAFTTWHIASESLSAKNNGDTVCAYDVNLSCGDAISMRLRRYGRKFNTKKSGIAPMKKQKTIDIFGSKWRVSDIYRIYDIAKNKPIYDTKAPRSKRFAGNLVYIHVGDDDCNRVIEGHEHSGYNMKPRTMVSYYMSHHTPTKNHLKEKIDHGQEKENDDPECRS